MTSRRTLVRILLGLLPVAIGLAFLPGCDDAYDAEIMYPGRTDWLVEKAPTVQPTRYDPPGLLPLVSLDGDKDSFGPDQDLLRREREDKHTIWNPKDLDPNILRETTRVLRDLAGRPRMPKIDLNDLRFEDTNKALTKELKLDRKTLAEGSKIYRTQCLHCHGVAGDGRGPTGPWVNPHPRDFRQGLFKFTSTDPKVGKPRREDLRRTLMNGVEGTSMPSFALLGADQVDALISYVIHLGIRGEAEYTVLIDLVKESKEKTEEPGAKIVDRIREAAANIGQRWLEAQKAGVVPTEELAKKFEAMTKEQRLESAARGYEIFTRKELGGCVQCHVNLGRDAPFYYDPWGTVVRPRNLTLTQLNLRGGRRPIDLYYRIRTGILGTSGLMPQLINSDDDLKAKVTPLPTASTKEAPLSSEEIEKNKALNDRWAKFGTKEEWIWDLVNFIQIAAYPEKRKELKDTHKIEID